MHVAYLAYQVIDMFRLYNLYILNIVLTMFKNAIPLGLWLDENLNVFSTHVSSLLTYWLWCLVLSLWVSVLLHPLLNENLSVLGISISS